MVSCAFQSPNSTRRRTFVASQRVVQIQRVFLAIWEAVRRRAAAAVMVAQVVVVARAVVASVEAAASEGAVSDVRPFSRGSVCSE